MALIPWKPFGDLNKFFEDDEWLLPVFPKGRIEPAMDIYETGKAVVAEVSVPNIDPKKINVSVENQVLRVSGSMEEEKKEEKKGYWRKEIRKGSFERMVRLPVPVDESKVEAEYEKGMLKITMPKTEAKAAKKVKVKAKNK